MICKKLIDFYYNYISYNKYRCYECKKIMVDTGNCECWYTEWKNN